MPRKMRFLTDGGIYHVFSRGNNRQALFRCPGDYHYYLATLQKLKDEMGIAIYHYCLMGNHIHLLMKINQKSNLPKMMHRLQLSYTAYYKRHYEYVGHLYQGRYRSPHIKEESYYLQCGRYIERNPVRAKIVKRAEQYFYSSAAYYVLGKKDSLVTPNIFYEPMGKDLNERRKAYSQFLSFEEPYLGIIEKELEKV